MSEQGSLPRTFRLGISSHPYQQFNNLPRGEVDHILEREWEKSFNCISFERLGADTLWAIFQGDDAVVVHKREIDQREMCSHNPVYDSAPDRDAYVRLSPDDEEDFSFPKRMVISKAAAKQLVDKYLNGLALTTLL